MPRGKKALEIKQAALGADNPQISAIQSFIAANNNSSAQNPPKPTSTPPKPDTTQTVKVENPVKGTAPVGTPIAKGADHPAPHHAHQHSKQASISAPRRRHAYSSYGF